MFLIQLVIKRLFAQCVLVHYLGKAKRARYASK